MKTILKATDAFNVYADAVLSDDKGYLAMASLWGRDTGIQELLARMTLSPSDSDGIESLRLEGDSSIELLVGDHRRFEKFNGRVPETVFGELAHVFVFDRRFLEPDYANRRGAVLGRSDDTSLPDRIWAAIKDLAAVPLLDEWRAVIMSSFANAGWIQQRNGINVQGTWIHLPEDEVDHLVGALVRDRHLPVAA